MEALIDGDSVTYRCAASADTAEDVSVALVRTDILIQEILQAVGADTYQVFLSGPKETNFRYKVDPQYKANRVSVVRPIYLESCKKFLETNWRAEVCHGYEADDGMGIAQITNHKAFGMGSSIICAVDKDMLQVPGRHYNFVRKEFREVTPDQGLKAFYTQTLVGDVSDGITGVVGIGPVKAAKILDKLLPEEYYDACKSMYDSVERFHRNCQLLYIWRKPDDLWQPPTGVYSGCEDYLGREEDLPSGTDTEYRGDKEVCLVKLTNSQDSLCIGAKE